MQKTKVQIIEETRDYYADASKRAYDPVNRRCKYKDEQGKMCAFGRCELNPSPTVLGDIYDRYMMFTSEVINQRIDEDLKEEYRGHGLTFWQDLQHLHDISDHFAEGTWSPRGHKYIETLIKKYGIPETSNIDDTGSVS